MQAGWPITYHGDCVPGGQRKDVSAGDDAGAEGFDGGLGVVDNKACSDALGGPSFSADMFPDESKSTEPSHPCS
uniref:Uncharacterized protein n=1 Tax=Oryza glumipatula TaxID=40148 RepID=A0A0D9Z0P7_9ORYZ